MTKDLRTAASRARSSYKRPQLTVFGSVRNLTGGSDGANGDTMSTFMLMP